MSANLSRKFLRALECPYCSRQFVSRRELLVHQWSHKERAAYQCTQCEKSFTREELFRRHMVNHQKEESAKVTCEICNKTFRNQRTLEQHHLKTHAGQKPFHCQTCGIQFSWKHNLRKHEHIHKDKPFACLVCHEAFRDVDALNMHIRMHKLAKKEQEREKALQDQWRRDNFPGVKEKEKVSEPKTFPRIVPVRDRPPPASNGTPPVTRDVVVEDNDSQEDDDSLYKPYKCKVCHQAFMYTFTLEAHMKGHSEENKRSAKNSGKGSVPSPLEKPNICNICNEAFRWEFCLDAHVKIHQQHQEDGTFYYKGNRVPKPVILAPPDPNVPPIIIKPQGETTKNNASSNSNSQVEKEQQSNHSKKEGDSENQKKDGSETKQEDAVQKESSENEEQPTAVVAAVSEAADVAAVNEDTSVTAVDEGIAMAAASEDLNVPAVNENTSVGGVSEAREMAAAWTGGISVAAVNDAVGVAAVKQVVNVAAVTEGIGEMVPQSLNDFGHIIRVELITATDDGLEEQVKVHEIEMTSGSTTIPTKNQLCVDEMASSKDAAVVSPQDAQALNEPTPFVVSAGDAVCSTDAQEAIMDTSEPSASELVELQNNLPSLDDIKYIEQEMESVSHDIQPTEQTADPETLTEIESVAQQIESANLGDTAGVDSLMISDTEHVDQQIDSAALIEMQVTEPVNSPIITEMEIVEPKADSPKVVKTKSGRKRRSRAKKAAVVENVEMVSGESVSASPNDVTASTVKETVTEVISADVGETPEAADSCTPADMAATIPEQQTSGKKSRSKAGTKKSKNRTRKSTSKAGSEIIAPVDVEDEPASGPPCGDDESVSNKEEAPCTEVESVLDMLDVAMADAVPLQEQGADGTGVVVDQPVEQSDCTQKKVRKGSAKRGRGRRKKGGVAVEEVPVVTAESVPAMPESCEPVVTPLHPAEPTQVELEANLLEVESKKPNKRTSRSRRAASRGDRSESSVIAMADTEMMGGAEALLSADASQVNESEVTEAETDGATPHETYTSSDVIIEEVKVSKSRRRSRKLKVSPPTDQYVETESNSAVPLQITNVKSLSCPTLDTDEPAKTETEDNPMPAETLRGDDLQEENVEIIKTEKTRKGRRSKKSKTSQFCDTATVGKTESPIAEYNFDPSGNITMVDGDLETIDTKAEVYEAVDEPVLDSQPDEVVGEAVMADTMLTKPAKSGRSKRGKSKSRKSKLLREESAEENMITELVNSEMSNQETETMSSITEDSIIVDYKEEEVKEEECQESSVPLAQEQLVVDKPVSRKRRRRSRKSAASVAAEVEATADDMSCAVVSAESADALHTDAAPPDSGDGPQNNTEGLPVEHMANIGGLEFYYSVSEFNPVSKQIDSVSTMVEPGTGQDQAQSSQIQPSIDNLIECDKLEIPTYDSSGSIPVLDVTNEDLLPELAVEKTRRKRRKSRSKKRKSVESDQDAPSEKKAQYEALLPSWDTPISATWDTAMMEVPINNLLQTDTSILDEKIELQDEPVEQDIRPETKKKGKKKRRKSDREKHPLTEINATMQMENWAMNTLPDVPTEPTAPPDSASTDSVLDDIPLTNATENIVDTFVDEVAADSPHLMAQNTPAKAKVRRRRRKRDVRKAIQSRVTAIRSEIDFESDSTQQSDSTAASVEPVISSLKLTVKFYSCEFCSKAFTRRTSLLAHRFFNHSPRNGNYYERTMSLKDLSLIRCIIGKLRKRYKRIYTTQRPYSCIECHKEFIHHGYLTFHEEGHENITRTYFCHHCDLTMYSWLECIAHQMNHRKGLC